MKKHRIIITSNTILILLLCFTPQSEGRSFYPFDKIFGGPLCYEWFSDCQDSATILFYNNLQYDDTENFTPFCNRMNHCYYYDEIFKIHEKRCVFSKWNQYIDTSQRPPPLSFNQLYI